MLPFYFKNRFIPEASIFIPSCGTSKTAVYEIHYCIVLGCLRQSMNFVAKLLFLICLGFLEAEK